MTCKVQAILVHECRPKFRSNLLHFIVVSAVGEFGFIGIHVKPEDAVAEIDHLTDVYDSMRNLWNLQVTYLIC